MKKVLLLFSLFGSLAFINRIDAQCSISNVSITPKSVSTASGCKVTVDLQYTVAVNGGSKHTIIHLWESSKYPNPAHVASDYPLAAAATGTMIGTIVINYQGTTPQILTSWPTGPGEFKNSTIPSTPILVPGGFSVSTVGSNSVVSFTNLVLPISDCNAQISITGDVWATQNDQSASCLAAGAIAGVANDPLMNGLLNCTSPSRTFNVQFKTLVDASITFSVYRDANGNGVFDAVDQAAGKLTVSGGSITPTTDVTINTSANIWYSAAGLTYSPQPGGDQASIFVVARKAGNTYDNVLRIQNSCAPLPVSFKSFSASRNNQTVSLKWETAFEQNNRGFYVQRNVNGEWKDVAFVFSSAEGGNSDRVLSYAYNDPSNLKTISYYRLLQVDLDGKGKYSEIRAVKGLEQTSKLMLFPNPGTSGKINVLFSSEASAKNILVYDATGRVVKSFKNVMDNSLSIDQLKPGIYNIQVTDLASQTTSSDKFIIKD